MEKKPLMVGGSEVKPLMITGTWENAKGSIFYKVNNPSRRVFMTHARVASDTEGNTHYILLSHCRDNTEVILPGVSHNRVEADKLIYEAAIAYGKAAPEGYEDLTQRGEAGKLEESTDKSLDFLS
jgi:hypothetical protein